jgi:phage-related protein
VATEEERIEVEVDLEDNLSRPARTAAENIDHLGEEAKETDRRLKNLQRQADRSGKSLEFLAIKARAANTEFDSQAERVAWMANEYKRMTGEQEKSTRATIKLTRETKRSEGGFRAFQRTMKRVTGSITGLPSGLMNVAKGLAAVGAVAAAAGAAQHILGMVAALTTLVSFAAVIPVAIGALIAVFGTLAVATKGIGEAMSAVAEGDAAKLEEALKNLSPSAQDFIRDINDMVPAFKKLKEGVQESLFKPFATQVKPTIEAVLPIIDRGMQRVATSIGYATAEWLIFQRSAAGKSIWENMFGAGEVAINNFSRAITPIGQGLAAVMQVARPYWDSFVATVGQLGVEFGQWMEKISASGELDTWIQTGIDVARQLGQILREVWDIIQGVMVAVGEGGGFTPLLGFLRQVSDWVNSDAGQGALTGIFSSLATILTALTPALTIVANAIGTTLAPAIADIVLNLAPGFTVFLQALANALTLITPYIGPLAAAFGQILVALTPLMPIIAQLAIIIAQHLTTALTILAPIINLVATTIATLLAPFLNAAAQAFQLLTPYIPMFTNLMVQMAAIITPLLQQVGQMLQQGLSTHLRNIAAMIPQLVPLIMELIATVGIHFVEALTMVMPYLPQIIGLLVEMMKIALQLAPVMLRLGIFVIQSGTKMLPIVGIVLKIIMVFSSFMGAVIKTISTILTWANRLASGFGSAISSLRSRMSGVVEAIAGPFRRARDTVTGIINSIKSTIANFNPAGLLRGAVSGLSALNPFRFAGGPVEAGQPYTVGEIGKELYVPKVGAPQVIGEGGMETRSFAGDGMILPSYMLKAMESANASMRKQAAAQAKMSLPSTSKTENHVHHHHHEDKLEAVFTGNISSDVDIERAVKKAWRDLKKDESERR